MASLTWLGHAAFLLVSDEGKRIYVDPFLTGNPKTPESEKQPERGRHDRGHARPRRPRRRHGRALEGVPGGADRLPGRAEGLARRARARTSATSCPGLNKGGTQEIDGIHFTLVERLPLVELRRRRRTSGEACGIVIRLEGGRAIYFAGDTCVFGDMALIRRLYAPDFAVLPIGDHFTMGPREAAVALELLGNPPCIPCHWGTFPLLTGTPDAAAAPRRRARPSTSSSRAARSIARRDLLDRRLRPRRRAVGRRDPVEVPRRRLGRAVGASRASARSRRRRYANPRYGPGRARAARRGACRGRGGRRLTGADDGRDDRQLGVVDAAGGSATFTGRGVPRRGRAASAGPCFAAQGNILVSDETVDGARRGVRGRRPGRRSPSGCVGCLAAAQEAGGDRRGQQSAALLVVERDGGYAGLSDTARRPARRRPPERPVEELGRLLQAPRAALRQDAARTSGSTSTTRSPRSSQERLARLGFEGDLAEALRAWSGRENLEERVDGIERIDPVVLEELRRR